LERLFNFRPLEHFIDDGLNVMLVNGAVHALEHGARTDVDALYMHAVHENGAGAEGIFDAAQNSDDANNACHSDGF
jgi:hypothetical protein